MIKVVFKKTIVGSGFHFRKGAEVELSNDRAKDYLNAGFCVAVGEQPKKRAKKSVAKPKSKESR